MVALALWLLGTPAQAEGMEAALGSVVDELPLAAWQRAYEEAFPAGEQLRALLLRIARGEAALDTGALLETLCARFLGALTGSFWRLSRLMVPAILCGVLERIRLAFAKGAVGETVSVACFLMLAGCMAQDMAAHLTLAQNAIARMADLMQTLFPLLLTLLAAVGGTAGTAVFQPTVVAACGTMTAVLRSVALPLAGGAAVTAILNHLSPRMRIGRLSSLFRGCANWTLGVSFTVFISVTAMQSLGAAAADGVTLRTAKYAVDNFVPVVGGMFADTMDTLVGASLLIKNALGVTGLMVLAAGMLGPMVQSAAAVMLYRAGAALLEPVADSRVSACMQDFSDILMLFFIVQLTAGAMFLLLIAQVLVVGNLTVMMR